MRSKIKNQISYLIKQKIIVFITIFSLIGLIISLVILIPNYNPINPYREYQLAYIYSIKIEGTTLVAQEITINIEGSLPNPCWDIDRHDLTISTSNKLMNISLWGVNEDITRVCICLLKSFNYNFQVVFPLSGNWTIKCNEKSINVLVNN